ncbi:MAG TPA: DUF4157 domain-containing protein [Nostocaceae cyanobacterium]|nr:DUF4157 domain-containing protein [Nostocaceae cyanobacterium]
MSSITRPDPTVQPQSTESETESQKQESNDTLKQQTSKNFQQPNNNNSPNQAATIQTKLTIGQPGDKYEQEADTMAQKVMSGNTLQLSHWPEKTTPKNPVIVRRKLSTIQQKADVATNSSTPDLENQLNSKKGGGSPLDSDTRSFMESRFGADFSQVRVHTDSTSVQMNRELGAQAFTHGNDIFFRDGKTPGKNELTAHELTHVIQQTGAVQPKTTTEQPETTDINSTEIGIQRACSKCEAEEKQEEKQNTPTIQAKADIATEITNLNQTEINIQPLCSECETEKKEEEKNTSTIQAKELPGTNWDLTQNKNLQSPTKQDLPPENFLTAKNLLQLKTSNTTLNNNILPPQQQNLLPNNLQNQNPENLLNQNISQSLQQQETPSEATQIEQSAQNPSAASQETPKDPEQAIREVDPAEVEAKKNEVLAQQQPQIEQVNQQLPQVEQASQQASQEATQPSQPIVNTEATVEAPPQPKTDNQAATAAEQAASEAQQAFSSAQSQPVPQPTAPAQPSPPVAPPVSGGMPIASDPQGDAAISNLTQQAQSLRQGGEQLLAQAAQVRANAQIITGNIQLVKQGVNQAEDGITKSTDHLQYRQEAVGKAKEALQVSEEKASKVAAEAPGFEDKANQGKEKTSPMSSKASELAGQNAANVPKDGEAAGKAQEQGQQLNKVASDTTKIDDAFTQTQQKAKSLTEEAAQATAKNTETKTKVQTMEQTLGQTQDKLTQMTSQNTEAKTQVEGLENKPEEMLNQAAVLEEKGRAAIQAAAEIEQRIQQIQAEYQQAMSNLPELEAAPSLSSEEGRYEDRENIDVVGALPSWLTGVDPVSEEQRQQAQLAAQERRNQQIAQINTMAGKPFEELTAGDKMGIALNLMGQNLLSSLTNIQWPDPAKLVLGMIDPRTSLTGALGGLSQILSGGANLLSAEQWAKDPLGNFLKSAADIATGLTVVLGSITALAGLITGILTAVTIVSLGLAAPITGPIIAFCATVMATVGGWTFVTGLVAAGLHSLTLIKNLADAATATTAEDLQNQSEQMTQDFTNAGSAAFEAVMARLDQADAIKLQNKIVKSGGGVRYAANLGAQGLPARVINGVQESGGARPYTRNLANSTRRNVSNTIKGAGNTIRDQGLGSFAKQTGSKIWNGIQNTAQETWDDLTLKERSLVPGGKGLSRDYLIGQDIPKGGSRAAATDARTGATNEMLERMRATGEIPPAAEPKVRSANSPSQANAELLESTASKTGKQLTPSELEGELDIVSKRQRKPISEGDYIEEVELGNGHEWKFKGDGTLCRFSNDPHCFFPNQLPERLQSELKLANRLGVKPVKFGDPNFDSIINEGTIKWAVTTDNELVIIPKNVGNSEISHSVLSGGKPVLAAGEAEIVGGSGQYLLLEINNHSGHYQPTGDSLDIGIEAFKKQGIDVNSASTNRI